MATPFERASDPLSRRVATGLNKIGLALRTRSWQEAADRGLTPTQGQILSFLRRRPQGARLTEVAEGLGITPPTASDAVASLEDKGLLRKARSSEDARSILLSLTAKGRAEAERADRWPDFLAAAVEEMSPEEQQIFLRGLVTMIRALQRRGEIPVSRMCVTCRFFRPNVHSDPARPHHCGYVDAAFGDSHLRVDCPDHQPAPPEQMEAAWESFASLPGKDRP